MTAAAVPAEKAGVRRGRAGFVGEDGQFLGRDETNRGKERSITPRSVPECKTEWIPWRIPFFGDLSENLPSL